MNARAKVLLLPTAFAIAVLTVGAGVTGATGAWGAEVPPSAVEEATQTCTALDASTIETHSPTTLRLHRYIAQ